jgi:hypothetical protein
MTREEKRLVNAIMRLQLLRGTLKDRSDKVAIDVAIEHIEARLVDLRGRESK